MWIGEVYWRTYLEVAGGCEKKKVEVERLSKIAV